MKISTKGRYGLRGIIDLAIHGKEGLISIKDVADRQGVSANYLEHTFTLMRKGGLIRSVKGFGGGYQLKKWPSQITIKEVITILEGDLSVVDRGSLRKTKVSACIESSVWNKVDANVDKIIANMTLADMIQKYYDNKDCI